MVTPLENMTEISIPTLEECVLDPAADLPKQPDYYFPDVFEPVWFTYRRPTVSMPPHHLVIYHALPDQGTLFYHFKRESDRKGQKPGLRSSIIRRNEQKKQFEMSPRDNLVAVMDNSFKESPYHEDTREKILAFCTQNRNCGAIIDAAFFPNRESQPTMKSLTFATCFAQLYFMNEFYVSATGDRLTIGLIPRKE